MLHVTAKAPDFTGSYRCNLAAVGDHTLHALSVAGDHTSIRFLHAAMREKKQRVSFRFTGWEDVSSYWDHWTTGSYNVRITHLGYDCWHLLALDDGDQFMLHDDDETLWAMIRSERFTTPVIRSWVPQIARSLRKLELLKKLTSYNCDAALLLANTESLDQVVAAGLKRQKLMVVQPSLAEAV